MPSKNPDSNKNTFKELEKNISPILVINNSSLKPYVELFDYAPENIYQQPLGSLVGFFEVKEYSEESAYIVNFLTSVLKKEYYINPKRPVAESLDSALHKVNLALSELAKQGNVEWLGKLNAAICVLEKNNTHFSVCGNAMIFLSRGQILTNITQDLASDELEPHPLKTFVNVSSGRLEKNDRLLITSEDIFHILSESELKKNIQRFEGGKFIQFLKTALSNQLEMIASLVVELKEPEKIKPTKSFKQASPELETANVFSEKTFAKTPNPEHITIEETQALAEALAEEGEEAEYIDKKTGHIYIQGQNGEIPEVSPAQMYWDMAKEKAAEGWFDAKNDLRRRYVLFKKQVAKKIEQRRIEKQRQAELAAIEAQKQEEARLEAERLENERLETERLEFEKQESQRLEIERIENERLEAEKLEREKQEAARIEKERLESKKVEAQQQLSKPTVAFNEAAEEKPIKQLSFKEKLRLAQMEQQDKRNVVDLRPKNVSQVLPAEEEIDFAEDELSEVDEFQPSTVKVNLVPKESKVAAFAKLLAKQYFKLGKYIKRLSKTIQAKLNQHRTDVTQHNQVKHHHTSHKHRHYAPQLGTISKSFAKFTQKQKLYTLGAIVLVFIVPLFIVRWMNRPKPHPISELQTLPPSPSEILASDKNMNLSPKEQTMLNRQDLVSTLVTTDGVVAITKSSIILLNDKSKEYPLPTGEGSAIKAAYMSDLALVFVVTDQSKVISFSPSSLKYTDNKIDLSGSTANEFFGTYMTYLYVLDPTANQIYRYPRADGGFGDKTNWYKDSASLSGVSDLTIDDSIYCIQNNKVLKFFKGQSQTLNLEASNTPVHFTKLFTTLDSSSLWALDTQNTRIVQYTKDGSILAQYHDDNLKSANSLAVDEKNKTAYISTSSGLISISL